MAIACYADACAPARALAAALRSRPHQPCTCSPCRGSPPGCLREGKRQEGQARPVGREKKQACRHPCSPHHQCRALPGEKQARRPLARAGGGRTGAALTQVCGAAEPGQGGGVVLRHAVPVGVHVAKVGHGIAVPRVGSLRGGRAADRSMKPWAASSRLPNRHTPSPVSHARPLQHGCLHAAGAC